jgi:hypothetical protein
VDARCAPERVVEAHLTDQVAYFVARLGPSGTAGLLIVKAEVIGVRVAETWTSMRKIWRRKFGVSPMVDASQSFHFLGRLSSYKSPALVMFMYRLASQTSVTSC